MDIWKWILALAILVGARVLLGWWSRRLKEEREAEANREPAGPGTGGAATATRQIDVIPTEAEPETSAVEDEQAVAPEPEPEEPVLSTAEVPDPGESEAAATRGVEVPVLSAPEEPAATDVGAPPLGTAETPGPDDLKRIEGIGPKISGALQAAGVGTYAQLAEADVARLRQILTEAGIRATPITWPEQAKLAAAGQWDDLQALQDELQGGRRT